MVVTKFNILVVALVYFIKGIYSWQFPFKMVNHLSPQASQFMDKFMDQIQASYHNHEEAEFEHYSSIPDDELPIELLQYIDDIVVRVNFTGNDRLRRFLLSNEDERRQEIQYKVWSRSNTQNYIDLQINEDNLIKLVEKFTTAEHGLKYDIIIEDLAQKVFETYPKDHKKKKNVNGKIFGKNSYQHEATAEVVQSMEANVFSELFFKEYRPLETINAWLEIIEQTFPEIVTLEDIGQTFEHRSYKVVHFSVKKDGVEHETKKTVVITGGVHAREWISVSSVLYTIYSMLSYYQENPTIFDNLDFLFIPVLNPDGYEYTWNTDRLWRKNRQETILPRCFGIDIDHSYDYHWTYSSDWACGEDYSGEAPFEAIESKIWNDYLNATNDDHKIYGYIDLHSYSQEILYPYAYSCNENPRDEENLIELAYGIAKSIRLQTGKTYNVLPACQDKDLDLLPDLGSGSALDFMYHNKAFWAYQLKLRDSGSHGFLLPGKYIIPVGKEIYAGIRYFCNFVLSE